MIVKNEAPVIKRCLATIKPWIDTWVITDTGSTDGTQEIIREFMKDLPGELVEVPWVDFAHNRNVALDLARKRADYSLFMDADQQFIPNEGFEGIFATKDCYSIHVQEPSLFGSLTTAYFLVRNQSPLYWKGVIHEYICGPNGPEDIDGQIFAGGSILSVTADGNRSQDPNKYLKDAAVLEKALKEEPDNPRYMFYLGQSYRNANHYAPALEAFKKRSQMEGTDTGETFFSLFMVAVLQENLGYSQDACLESLIKAHEFKPSRPEPAYKMGQIYMARKENQKTYDLLKPYVFVYDLEDQSCIQADIRDFLLPILFSCTCYQTKRYEECYNTLKKISTLQKLPDQLKKEIEKDLAYLRTQIPYLV
jgi:glycosyltransferase involved in cell wall biosynthesis